MSLLAPFSTSNVPVDEPVPLVARIVLLVLSLSVYGAGFLGLAYAIRHRNYPPLKAKHIPFLAVAFIGCFLWFIGELHAHGLLGYEGIFQACSLWGVWIHFVFGVELLLVVLTLRLYALYRVFVRQQPISQPRMLVLFIVFYTPVLAVGIWSSAAPSSSVTFDVAHQDCRFQQPFKAALFAICALGLLLLGWFTWALRHIRRGFNEFAELRAGFLVALLGVLVNSVIIMSLLNYTLAGKILVILTNMVAGNAYLWLVLFRPLYGCMFRREETLRRFIVDLNIDGGSVHPALVETGTGDDDDDDDSDSDSNVISESKAGSKDHHPDQATHSRLQLPLPSASSSILSRLLRRSRSAPPPASTSLPRYQTERTLYSATINPGSASDISSPIIRTSVYRQVIQPYDQVLPAGQRPNGLRPTIDSQLPTAPANAVVRESTRPPRRVWQAAEPMSNVARRHACMRLVEATQNQSVHSAGGEDVQRLEHGVW